MVDRPHGFIIHWIVILKNIKKVTKVIDVKNWRVDNSRVLKWIVSLVEWNSSVSSTKSSIRVRSEDVVVNTNELCWISDYSVSSFFFLIYQSELRHNGHDMCLHVVEGAKKIILIDGNQDKFN
nr:hypothetical protein [Tanacetum cinerariifolium]